LNDIPRPERPAEQESEIASGSSAGNPEETTRSCLPEVSRESRIRQTKPPLATSSDTMITPAARRYAAASAPGGIVEERSPRRAEMPTATPASATAVVFQ
jgi:hypothetical protein